MSALGHKRTCAKCHVRFTPIADNQLGAKRNTSAEQVAQHIGPPCFLRRQGQLFDSTKPGVPASAGDL